MATLRNKRKLAAVSRETPEGSRSSRAQNVLDAESAQDYISQVSEEIVGRVTKKLSKEFSKTESHILGALSKIDELLLNPQARTCSVSVPGTSRNNNSENRETTGDRPQTIPTPKWGIFLITLVSSTAQRQKTTLTGVGPVLKVASLSMSSTANYFSYCVVFVERKFFNTRCCWQLFSEAYAWAIGSIIWFRFRYNWFFFRFRSWHRWRARH